MEEGVGGGTYLALERFMCKHSIVDKPVIDCGHLKTEFIILHHNILFS